MNPLSPSPFLNAYLQKNCDGEDSSYIVYCGQTTMPVVDALRLLAPDLFKKSGVGAWRRNG